jgi:hypothetical protein
MTAMAYHHPHPFDAPPIVHPSMGPKPPPHYLSAYVPSWHGFPLASAIHLPPPTPHPPKHNISPSPDSTPHLNNPPSVVSYHPRPFSGTLTPHEVDDNPLKLIALTGTQPSRVPSISGYLQGPDIATTGFASLHFRFPFGWASYRFYGWKVSGKRYEVE